jgi:glycosyltransferase involved in cell wall biosynthesis
MQENVPAFDVLVPGAYHEQKRFEDVIRAAALVGRSDLRIRFVGSSAGARERRGALQALAATLGVAAMLHFDDETSNLPAALRSSGLVLLPSRAEGLPIVALEAVAVGAPTAWSSIQPHSEVFGPTGKPFPVGDTHAIAAVLGRPTEWEAWRPSQSYAASLFDRLRTERARGVEALLGLGD